MIDFVSHIEYLLLRHDCVVVPGLGAFLVHESEAYYNARDGLFMPPMRTLGFNAAVTHNDGLLAESVARRTGMSIDLALAEIAAEVTAFRAQLAIDGYMSMGSLGVMSVSTEPDAIVFEPEAVSAISVKYTGWGALPISYLREEEPVDVPDSEADTSRPNIITWPLRVAASILAIVVACGILYTTTNLVDDAGQHFAKLDSGLTERFESKPAVVEPAYEISREIVLNIAAPAEGPALVDTTARTSAAPAVVDNNVPGRYLLVVASYETRRSAERHIAYAGGGSDMHIIAMDGKYRVYISSFPTLGKAKAEIDSVRNTYPNVWICKR